MRTFQWQRVAKRCLCWHYPHLPGGTVAKGTVGRVATGVNENAGVLQRSKATVIFRNARRRRENIAVDQTDRDLRLATNSGRRIATVVVADGRQVFARNTERAFNRPSAIAVNLVSRERFFDDLAYFFERGVNDFLRFALLLFLRSKKGPAEVIGAL